MISLIILALLLATVVFSLFRWAEAIGYSKGVRDAAKIAGVEVPPLSKWFPFDRRTLYKRRKPPESANRP